MLIIYLFLHEKGRGRHACRAVKRLIQIICSIYGGLDYEGYKTKNGLRMRNMDCLFTGDFIVFWQGVQGGKTKNSRMD